jgi:hypothetical protein
MQEAIHAQYNVVLMPLKESYRKLFDNAKAQAFWEATQGLPYGYHEYLWEWVDDGNNNIPWHPNDQGQGIGLIFEAMQKFLPNASKIGAWSMMLQAVNNRLGTHFGAMIDMYKYFMDKEGRNDVYRRMMEVVSMPEQDSYEYWNHPTVCNETVRKLNCTGRSMICEVFVFSTLKAAGVFGDLDFEAAEVDPRSAYLANIWDVQHQWPDPRCTSGFCQVIGNWTTPLAGAATVDVSPHFAEKCQDLPPSYARVPSNC